MTVKKGGVPDWRGKSGTFPENIQAILLFFLISFQVNLNI